MAFSKSKHVENAQKLLNQGKIAQAIAEYQHILKYEPKDQVTLMTIGELYIRQGETFQAIDYFERLAQLFVGDGFLTKAIAVYKRIAKLAPEEIRPLEKLADLYVQQGVMSEARPLFLQLAEIHLKSNRQSEATGLLKKLLAAEPDNLRIQTRLADLYQAMGQSKEAVETFIESAQRAVARGDQAEGIKLAEKALKLDPKNAAAITVKARASAAEGNTAHAAQLLQHAPSLDQGGEQAELLLDLYLKNARWDDATELAMRVLQSDDKNFALAQKVAESELNLGEADRAIELIAKLRVPMIDAGEHEPVTRLLNELAARLPGRLEPLEWLVDTYGRISDSFRLPDALAQLGGALVAADKLDRAKEVFEKLLERQPDNDAVRDKLNEVLSKLGQTAAEEPAAVVVPEKPPLPAQIAKPPAPKLREVSDAPAGVPVAKAVVPSAEPALDEDTQRFISQSLTDVDLFASYGLTQKAISLLDTVLRRAPRHAPTLEKLLDFALGAGDDRRTAELAAQLEQIHRERSDERGAERFGELRRRFQRAAGLSDAELAPAPAAAADAVPTVQAQPKSAPPPALAKRKEEPKITAPPEPVPAAETRAATASAVHEVDLSDEWSSLLQDIAPGKAQAPTAPAEEFEVKELPVEAEPAEDAAAHHAQPAQGHSIAEPTSDIPGVTRPERTPAEARSATPAKKDLEATIVDPVGAAPSPADAAAEFELEQDYELVLEPEPLQPAHEQPGAVSAAPLAAPPKKPPAPPAKKEAAQPAFAADQFLAELASEIDQLGLDQLSPEFSKKQAKPAPSAPIPVTKAEPSSIENEPLREVFEEFRAELGEMGAEDEDLETHYNLGIAFREMGLLEEAIGEFQKVAQAHDRGHAFRYAMQCSTLLGLAFMEKGRPAIAALWYERALQTPGIDPESALALRYDLGVAQESAGELEAALKSFSRVYAMNIDYRDVAERIAALEKTAGRTGRTPTRRSVAP